MDQNLLRSYMSTVYELPTDIGVIRVSLDGELTKDASKLPELLRRMFGVHRREG